VRIDRESHTIKTDKMKKAGLILILVSAIFLNGNSQNIDDALRYSQVFYSGTARFNAMGGAFTALGGDLSAISLNPAGAGVFRSFEFSLTPQLYYNNTTSRWNGSSSSDFRYNLNLNQIGVVTNIFSSGNETGLVSLNGAYSFNRTNNFNENITISGISDNSSMADYWAGQANADGGIFYKNLTGAAGIAYDAWILDTISGAGAKQYATAFSAYGSNTNSTYGQTIRRIISNDGYTGEHSFSVGGNYANKIYFGATIGISSLKYTGHYQHLEADDNMAINDFKNFSYTDHFEASGTGYSLKIGTIIRPVEFIRFGLSFHSPVVYRISEYFYDNITSAFDNGDKYEFSNNPMRYKYTFTTPLRANAGVALQIKKLAIISADYEIVDYRMSRFSKASDNYDYYTENSDIKNIYKSSSNLRLGAEFRLSSIYLRGGYNYYGKAFKQGEVNENLDHSAISFGIGMRQQNFYFDLALTSLSSSSKYYMYNDPPYLEPATIKAVKNTFTATMGFKF
jgi:hypothetical protein